MRTGGSGGLRRIPMQSGRTGANRKFQYSCGSYSKRCETCRICWERYIFESRRYLNEILGGPKVSEDSLGALRYVSYEKVMLHEKIYGMSSARDYAWKFMQRDKMNINQNNVANGTCHEDFLITTFHPISAFNALKKLTIRQWRITSGTLSTNFTENNGVGQAKGQPTREDYSNVVSTT
ncbi:uncharacterized protein EAE98_010306 [Botrytis deweyae]|uniref:Uncharacterized protein n=1 Tax=Botrytis deweyae TaxID=2478750 RepID=A0ABQ7I9E6_9HELO|nr:uncharacterized protein EAE98_010306 [Botrytis deweyae]KAF7917201.1 hypothetical protein EAE98_010306 [Botrytis deweyae]